MKKGLIYFDNAATTFPKPEAVYRAKEYYERNLCGNPSRGSHRLALAASEAVYKSREALAELYSSKPENVVFTMNTTYALNIAIKSIVKEGDHVLISDLEHNSVLRPVNEVCKRRGAAYDIFSTRGGIKEILSDIDSKKSKNTRLLVCTHQSNIIPKTLDLEEISQYCRENGIYMVADCAQSAGNMPLDLSKCTVDIVCVPSHKGLYGTQGCGALIFGDIAAEELLTTIEGGSGSNSVPLTMPEYLPDRFEAGTLPSPAVASLAYGISFVKKKGLQNIRAHEDMICQRIMNGLSCISGITVYNEYPGPVLLFNFTGRNPSEIASAFDEKGICLRSGLHCSPLAHRTVGTFPEGAVRASFGAFNSIKEADIFCEAAEYIAKHKRI